MRKKLFLSLAIFSVFLLALTFFFTLWQLRSTFKSYNLANLKSVLVELEREFITSRYDCESLLMGLVSRHTLISLIEKYQKSYFYTQKEKIRGKLIEFFYPYRKSLSFLRLYLSNDYLLVDLFSLNRKGKISKKSFLEEIIKEGKKKQLILYQNGKAIYVVVSPIYSGHGKRIGALALGFSIEEMLNRIKKYTNFDLYFLREKDRKLDLVASTIYFYSPQSKSKFLEKFSHSSGNHFNFKLGKAYFDVGLVMKIDGKEKNEFYLLLGSVQTLNLSFLSEEIKRTFLIIFLLAILISLLSAYWLSRKVTIPLKQLHDFALSLGKGNYGKTIDLNLDDEVGVLAQSLNKMSLELKKATDELNGINEQLKKEVEQIKKELQSLYRELETAQKLSALGFFAAGVIHEIKNPLSTLKGTTAYLKSSLKKGNFDFKYLDNMAEEIDRLQKLSQSITNYAKVDYSYKFISEILEPIEKIFSPELMKRKIKLKIEIKENLKFKIYADHLKQIIVNLLMNSIEALSEKENGHIFIVIERKNEKEGEIKIADDGKGIAKENLDKIFQPFFTVGKENGTGLGLAIVKKLLDEVGGSIKVESSLGKGTVFKIIIPLD